MHTERRQKQRQPNILTVVWGADGAGASHGTGGEQQRRESVLAVAVATATTATTGEE